MNNPIEINAFRHFLEVNGTRTEILEPIGFDASNFVCEQNSDGYGRDVFYGNTDADLEFHYEYGINDLPSGLELILEQEQLNGSESNVNYILQKNGIDFTVGQLDFVEAQTDYASYFKCKVIQNNEQAKIKKRKNIKVDAFSNKDLDDNTITPIQTYNLLLKAKPTYGISEWNVPQESINVLGGIGGVYENRFNYANANTKYGIENSVSYIAGNGQRNNFIYINAVNDLSNVNLSIDIDVDYYVNDNTTSAYGDMAIKYYIGTSIPNTGVIGTNIYTGDISFNNNTDFVNVNTLFQANNLTIPATNKLWIWFENFASTANTAFFLTTKVKKFDVTITATETGIDSVVKAVRYIDLIKQNYKAINSLPVNAPKFDTNGEFYNQMCFNGKLIRQIINEPFYLQLDQTNESLLEVNACPQINNNEIYIGQYIDFYSDVLMGSYPMHPDASANFTKNEKYLINKFKYGYSKYEQDRDEDNTLDAIHTDSEWYVPCDNSINTKEIKNPFVRDPFKIETVRRRATEKTTTSNDSDDDIFIVDVIEIAPGTTKSISQLFTFQQSIDTNTMKILANQTFRWDLLGFEVGNTVTINYQNTITTHTVIEITPTILTISWSGSINFSGQAFYTITYPITNVLYTTRTNEGLIFSDNLLNADKYANLRYSIKRNMRHWQPYLATVGKFIPTKEIKNSYFKSNGEAITKFTGESANVKENANVLISDIASEKILNQNIFKTTIIVEFEDMVTLMGKIQTEMGYIEVIDHNENVIKGYIKELEHTWATNECNVTLELKN